MHPIARLVLGLAAGLFTEFLADCFVWPGTREGAIGVVIAAVLALANWRAAS